MAGQHLDKINQSKNTSKQTQAQPELEQHHKPFRLEDADVMDLQRQLGNQATQNVLGIQRKADAGLPSLPGVIQAKMTVNEPGDEYEHEADRVAHEVMTMPDPVQREMEMEEDEMMMKPIQREMEMEEDEMMMKPIQREMEMEEDEMMMKPIQREMEMEEDEMMMKPIQREMEMEEDEMMMKPISSLQRDSAA